jgi:hypothetical protein
MSADHDGHLDKFVVWTNAFSHGFALVCCRLPKIENNKSPF